MRSKNIIFNVESSLILQVITLISGFLIQRAMINVYGSTINGLVVSITQFLSCITLLEAGFGPVIKSLLYSPIAKKDKNEINKILKSSEKIFRTIAYIFLIYIFSLCLFFPIRFLDKFDSFFTISLIVIISISTFAEYFFGMTYKIYLQSEQKTYIVNIIQIISIIFNLCVILVLILSKVNIQIVKLISSIIFLIRPILQIVYVKKKFGINLKDIDNTCKINQKWDGLIQHFAYIVHKNADIVILTLFNSLLEISVYSIYYMIVNGVKNLALAFDNGIDSIFGNIIANGEKENLNKSFKMYEELYFFISTILFCSTLFLIIPFVSLYTNGIKDVNYIRPVFAFIVVISEFICILRQPYNDLVKCTGKFKQTKNGAIVESVSNIVISLILVQKYGIVGVAIGTLVGMIFRTIDLMYYASKNILERSVGYTFKRLGVVVIEILIVAVLVNFIPKIQMVNYLAWIIQAIIIFGLSVITVFTLNYIFYKECIIELFKKIKVLAHK